MPLGAARRGDFTPLQFRLVKRRLGVGVGNRHLRGVAGEFFERGELAAAAVAHGVGELGPEIAEEQKRRGRGEFLAHEQHRHVGRSSR